MGHPAVPFGPPAPSYQRHRPETTTLYAVVSDNVETLYAAVAADFEGAALPRFARREFDGYLDCGLLCRGFARMQCNACVEQHLVAFSCKGRGFCPSCLGRRMCQTATNLIEPVLPPVPLRQWVLTLPFELRGRLGFDGKLLGTVARLFVDSVLGWYRRRLRASTREHAESGAVVVVQRDPALAKLARAAVSGLAPAGPELRRHPVELAFEGRPGVLITAPLSVREHGFSLICHLLASTRHPARRQIALHCKPSPEGYAGCLPCIGSSWPATGSERRRKTWRTTDRGMSRKPSSLPLGKF